VEWLKNIGLEASSEEISPFTWDLQDGKIVNGFKYPRRNFYTTLLKCLLELGFITKTVRYLKK
jgi:hypothetical protein